MKNKETIERAVNLHMKGEVSKAIPLYEIVLGKNKNNAQVLYLLGTAYLQVGNIKSSKEFLLNCLKLEPSNVGALNNLGTALNNTSHFHDAAKYLEKAISIKPNYPDAYNNYGNTLKGLFRLEEALKNYEQAIKFQPHFAEAFNNRGGVLFQLKKYPAALDCYNKAIELKPQYFDAHNNKGVVLREMSQFANAIECFDAAIGLNPNYFEIYNNRGLALNGLYKFEEALQSFYISLKLNPYNETTYNNLGLTYNSIQKYEDALFCLEKALELRPEYADALTNKGNALKELNKDQEALMSYEKALEVSQDSYRTHNNKGVVLQKLNQVGAAIESYEKCLAINPEYAEAYNNMGVAYQSNKNLIKASWCYAKAIEISPEYPDAHYNYANALRDLKRNEEALTSYGKAIIFRPSYGEAYNNRAFVLQYLGRHNEALKDYDQALLLLPQHPAVHHNRGNVLKDLKRLDEALVCYSEALRLDPSYEFLLGTIIHLKMQLCNWEKFEENLNVLIDLVNKRKPVTTPFALLGLVDDPALHKVASEIYTQIKFPQTAEKLDSILATPDKPLKIGYFSGDFYNHATAYLMGELFSAHDKAKFELYGFSFSQHKNDEMTKKLASSFHEFIDITNKTDKEVVEISRGLKIDIAVDLKGYTNGTRASIFAGRCAPIQVSYLGYPGTLGAGYIDYIIADETVVPRENQRFFTEKIVYLPNSYQVNDSNRKISDKKFTRNDFGLPEKAFVFCCFNNNYKILPSIFEIWMRILNEVEGSVLWLFEDNSTAANNLRQHANARGVDGARLIFAKRMPLEQHLARHRLADLFLDTLPYNAHTTASDALWAGLPVVTCVGSSFASRVAASLLTALDLTQLITYSHREYESKAIELAMNSAKLSAIRQSLNSKRTTSTLFDGKAFAKYLEFGFVQMYERHCRGLKHETFFVDP